MSIEVGDLILVSVFTGIGTGIGVPVGQWIFERFIKHSAKRLTEIDIVALRNNYPSMRLLDDKYERGKRE